MINMDGMIKGVDYPEWYTDKSLRMVHGTYTLPEETPKEAYRRLARTAASYVGLPNKEELEEKFFDYLWKGWLCPASPVLSNVGTNRGLGISCFTIDIGDSVDSIFAKIRELAMLSKHGGGVGVNATRIRPRATSIKGNGKSEGIVPWLKIYDSATISVNQGGTRKGATSVNLNAEHGDIEEFLRIRRPEGDPNRQCLNLHHCVQVTDSFMDKVVEGKGEERDLWVQLLKTRMETGEPYIMYQDTVNKANPKGYEDNGLEVSATNLCSEITLYTDPEHSFVCCLSSLNLAKYDEWKDTDLPYISILFLEGVMEEFISKAKDIPGFECAVRFAQKSRALGLGVLGWHTLLQDRGLPFAGLPSMQLNAEVFRRIHSEAVRASEHLAGELGEPEWCKGTGRRHTHLLAVAPTSTNSIISGSVSAGIEPIPANVYTLKTAKGSFISKNPILERELEKLGMNTPEVWTQIMDDQGSVQALDIPEEVKEVFLTAYEINQMALVQQAAQRQQWICQSQSLNLFFPANVSASWFNKVHLEAWKLGVKTLYYVRSGSVLRADLASRAMSEVCESCEG